jgi:hypothetical protein
MVYKGIVRGRTIELEEEPLGIEGKPVAVSVEILPEQSVKGSPVAILQAAQDLPHLQSGEVDELEYEIQKGKLPVVQQPFNL